MRIENIDKNNLKKESDKELFNLRMRFIQIFNKFYKSDLYKESKFNFLDRKDFLSKYKLLNSEITGRKLKVSKSNELDKVIFSKEMTGVDVRSLPEVSVANDYISIHGSFLKSPKEMGSFSIYINDSNGKRTVEVEERVRQLLEEELGKNATVTKSADDIPEDCIPLYDLVLKPIDGTKPRKEEKPVMKTDQWGQPAGGKIDKDAKKDKEDITKPYPTEHSARLQDPAKYDSFKRTKGGKIYFKTDIPADISIIWGHPKGKAPATWIPQGLRFDKDKYTVAQAKKFLADNKIKYIKFEAAKEGAAKKKKEDKQKYNCTCIECGHKLKTDEHCKDVKCPKCGGTMRRAERPGVGEVSKLTLKILKADKKEFVAGGIVTSCEKTDTQGDIVSKDEIWKGMKSWMLNGGKVKLMHKGKDQNIKVIECFQADSKTYKGGTGEDHLINKGDWYAAFYFGETKETKEIFKGIIDGELHSFSMGGEAASREV